MARSRGLLSSVRLCPDGWVELVFSTTSGTAQCLAAAPTTYTFGSEQAPLRANCAIHNAADVSWFWGNLSGSRGAGEGENIVFDIDTKDGLSLTLVTDGTGTLELQASDANPCTPTATAIIGNDVRADFDCPLLVDPSDATSACGLQGTVYFENCGSE